MPRVTQWILSTSVASLSRTSSNASDDRTGSRSSFSFQHYLRRRKKLVSDSMLKLKEGGGMAGLVTGKVGWARPCDSCQSEACLVYCQTDTAYLCASCDGRVHAANHVAFYHERVWVCEACEREPAVISCNADAAVLCADCDADIHSANPLALRHHRVPAPPVSPEEVAAGCRARVVPPLIDRSDGENVDEEASWSLPDPIANGTQDGNGFVYDGEIDEYLDLGEYNSCGDHQNQEKEEGRDGIVPGGSGLNQQQQHGNFHSKMESDAPKAEFCYTTDSISHCDHVQASHLSSVLVSVVSDATSVVGRGTTQQLSVLPYQTEVPMDREARVQRYKEKKKMRKFEKTIRYASRKAYAEVRPRIKGRFAKRSDVEVEVEQLFSVDRSRGYGVVPTL